MAVILAYGSPALGHLFPLAALLSELAERGHQVHLRTMSTGVAKAQAAGIYAEPVDARIEAIVAPDWMARNALGVLKMSIDVLCQRAVLEVDDLRAVIERVQPSRTRRCANSSPTVWCSIARAVRSPMAGWARRSRRWTTVCRSVSFRSLAIRPRSRGASRWLAAASGYRPTNSARQRCAMLFGQR